MYNVKAKGHVAKLRANWGSDRGDRAAIRWKSAGVAELADAQDLGSCVLGRGSSSLPTRTEVQTPPTVPPLELNLPVDVP